MLVYYFVPFIVSICYLLFWVSNGHNSVTVQNRTHVYMNFFDHKDLGNHLLQLCPKVVKHLVEVQKSVLILMFYSKCQQVVKSLNRHRHVVQLHEVLLRKALQETMQLMVWMSVEYAEDILHQIVLLNTRKSVQRQLRRNGRCSTLSSNEWREQKQNRSWRRVNHRQ